MKINYKRLIIFVLVPVLLGTLVGLLTSVNTDVDSIIPKWIFPVVWTILYVLMGVSSYLVYEKDGEVPRIYIIQLIFNLLWSFVFFTFKWYFIAFLWILVLIYFVIRMVIEFYKYSRFSAYLQIPYLLWLSFATILNLAVVILN